MVGPQDWMGWTKRNHLMRDGQSTPQPAAFSAHPRGPGWVCSPNPPRPDLQGQEQPAAKSHHLPAGGSPVGHTEGDRLQEVAAHRGLWSSPGPGTPPLLLVQGSWPSLQTPGSLDAFIKYLEGSQLFEGFKISH